MRKRSRKRQKALNARKRRCALYRAAYSVLDIGAEAYFQKTLQPFVGFSASAVYAEVTAATKRTLHAVHLAYELQSLFFAGWNCCVQDKCENAAFASIGGPAYRCTPKFPRWLKKRDIGPFWRGYRKAAGQLFGNDWRTCPFEWAPALQLESSDGHA